MRFLCPISEGYHLNKGGKIIVQDWHKLYGYDHNQAMPSASYAIALSLPESRKNKQEEPVKSIIRQTKSKLGS